MRKNQKIYIPAFALLTTCSYLYPNLLGYDSFTAGTDNSAGEYELNPDSSYTDRYSLEGTQNPALSGFTGTWERLSGASSPFALGDPGSGSLQSELASSLAYSDGTNTLVTSGNAAYRPFGTAGSFRSLDVANLGADGSTMYFSYLMEVGGDAGYVEFSENSASDGSGLSYGTDGVDFLATVDGSSTNLGAKNGDTQFVVWKVDFGASSDDWSLWVNPSDLTSETTASLTGSAAGIDPTTLVLARSGNSGGTKGLLVDEIRIGTNWNSVTPVPEPTTAAGVASLLAFLFVLSKKRKRLI